MPIGTSDRWNEVSRALAANRFEDAVALLKQLVSDGDWRAATALGAIFESKGAEDSRHYVEAAHWYSNAIAKEDRAEPNLGLARYYYYGLGGVHDFARAYRHLLKAYSTDNYEAVLMMAEILYQGAGVTRNLMEAEKLFRTAADVGYAYGFVGLSRVEKAKRHWLGMLKYGLRALITASRLAICDKNSPFLLGLGKKRGRLAIDGVVSVPATGVGPTQHIDSEK